MPANPHAPAFRSSLLDIPDTALERFSAPAGLSRHHLFTDGSCFLPELSELSVAAWGVVSASSGLVVARGQLAGIQQSIDRAELTAVMSAVSWAAHFQVSAVVWTDALHIVQKAQALQDGLCVTENTMHVDLWQQLEDVLRGQETLTIRFRYVRYVPGHVEISQCESPFEEWAASHNRWADTVAVQTNLNRDAKQAQLHHQMVDYYYSMARRVRALRSIYFAIADSQASHSQSSSGAPEEDKVEESELAAPQPAGDGSTLSDLLPLGWRVALRTIPVRAPR